MVVELLWVPRHQVIQGNKKTDQFAVNGLFLDEACNNVLTPLVVVTNNIDDWELNKITII